MLQNSPNKNIYFIGIGGSGMSGLAHLLIDLGFCISGSDIKNNPVIDLLKERGATIFQEHHIQNIHDSLAAVVYSNAIPNNNPEILKAQKLHIPIISRAELVKEILLLYRPIGVTGTHGKTTTTSMVGSILDTAQLSPSLMLGGSTKMKNQNAYLGSGEYFVYEACEAFGSIDYMFSEIAIITNIDNDHMDFYQNMDNLLKTFTHYINRTPFYGLVVLNGDDPYIRQILPKINKPYILCGLAHNNGVYADNITFHGFQSSFDVFYKQQKIGRVTINIPGKHNIYNSLLAIATALHLNISISDIQKALLDFQAPFRRFHSYGLYNGAYIIDDYAHHPTEVTATIRTALEIKLEDPNISRIIVIFQPHLYSRTQEHLIAFALALSEADFVILAPIYGAREINDNTVSSAHIGEELEIFNFKEYYVAKDFTDTYIYTKSMAQAGDIIITMGAGNIHEIASQLAEEQ